jgi:phosphohistidine phosphatase SixA
MKRRDALALVAAAHWPALWAQDADALAAMLRTGACAVLIRHAATEPGIGDPPNFRLSDCNTQRQLSDAGRAQSRRIGQWFKARQLQARAVHSSAWCRCRDTAELAFGRHTVWPALNSTFSDSSRQDAQTHMLRQGLQTIPPGQFEVWVTHQVNITALTGEWAAIGEAFLVAANGRLLARSLAFLT